MKQQVWYIGGGESFLKHDDFLVRLKTIDLWHMEEEVGSSWTTTIEEELGEDFEFYKIPMPNKQNADYKEWSIWFERHFSYMKGQPIFIGFSLGAMFLAKYLTQNKPPVNPKAVFLLAGAYDLPNFTDNDAGNFLISPDDVTFAAQYPVIIMHSKDDFVVPFIHGEAMAAALPEAEFMVFENKNHFLVEEFSELVAKIKDIS